ncbi:beta-galactosidase [Fontivita pretiosa]|uniref:beta-galactosidase n=1 Tax=Fontivita pretiosa TaxID=2989684 RepID=UPI003D16DBD9
MFDRFYYGVCYYPEAWDPRRHESDIQRIARAGFNLVRMGEGAWSYWEPQEGRYQFELFDRVIELCRRHGIRVILGTPTYAGPAWIANKYPEVLRWNFERIPMKHGSRRFYNYTSPKFLELSDRICTALAEHYKDNDAVIGWQLDNEFNCHMDVSYAPSDTLAFRAWLKSKYRTIERLNRAWGTKFWSQTYSDWDEIDLPHPTATVLNPTQLLDESRFISDTVVSFAQRQAAILRRFNRRWLITHNGLFGNIDGPALAAKLDFFSHDQYPLFYNDWPQYALDLVQARSLSFPWAILEQQSGPGGQMHYLHRTPRPGEIRLWAWQSIAHGARLLSYFRWRTCPYAQEQHWHGLLDPDNRDNRRLQEATTVGRELRRLPPDLLDAPVVRSVALLRDFDNDINERRINTYIQDGAWELGRWHAALAKMHIPVDIVWPTSDLSGYRVLVAPHLKILDAAIVKRMYAFVRGGGTLILGAQSGSKDRNGHLVQRPLPGLLCTLANVQIDDWTTLPQNQTRTARMADGGASIEMISFVERLRPLSRSTKVLATWVTDDDLLPPGSAAITLHRIGRGAVIYIGGYLPTHAINAFVRAMIDDLSVSATIDASEQVEAVARQMSSGTAIFLLNHDRSSQRVAGLADGAMELLTGRRVSGGHLVLPPRGVAIVAPRSARGRR